MNTQNNKLNAAPPGAAFCINDYIFVSASEKASLWISFLMVFISASLSFIVHYFARPLTNISFHLMDLLFGILLIFPVILIHEFIHFLSLIFMGIPSKLIKFGFNRKNFNIFCCCKVEIKIYIYRISLIMPFVFIGLIPLIISFLFLNFFYSLCFSLGLSICSADMIVFLKSFNFSKESMVLDHSVLPGFWIKNHFKKS